jgi:glycosyltransferase involved in cell wall biosynthesis
MAELSVIIPGRNEEFMSRTIVSILAAIRGDTEIIAIIDGENAGPEPPVDPRVWVFRNEKSIGQRQCINLGVRMSNAKYILKTDAHSMLDEGFDVKLAADCEYDWTVIPRMYNLHAFDLICSKCGLRLNNHRDVPACPQCKASDFRREVIWAPKMHKKTDWMYFRSPDCKDKPMRVQYYGNKDFVCKKCGYHHDMRGSQETCQKCRGSEFVKQPAFPAEFKAHRLWAKRQGDIAEVMTGQGACWFMHRERFLELGGMDEGHGSWGQVGVEVACKAWLSGGKLMVNRKTWFSHFFRCGDGPHFPYSMSGKAQERARRYSRDFWSSGRWPLQKYPLEWLAERFWPVPTWKAEKVNPELRNFTPHEKIQEPVKRTKRIQAPAKTSQTVPQGGHQTPVVSVLIPARNEKFLGRTVEDLLSNLRESFEILIGLDGVDQDPAKCDIANPPWPTDPRVRVIVSETRIGMRPMINMLAKEARGRFLMKVDAHVAIAEGLDSALIDSWEPYGAVVPKRYDLDTKKWKRRVPSRTECRLLTHKSEDSVGLRSMPWQEYSDEHADEEIIETMSCSGSLWFIERSLFWLWDGWDQNHGTFAQEGCELACKIWLSGGRLLLNKKTWYAHWNRGKTTYALGANEKPKSIKYSHELWLGDNWYYQKYAFAWLIEKFNPPGWPAAEPPETIPAIRMGGPAKAWRKGVKIADLWRHRQGIAEPDKRHRLTIFWRVFEDFVRSILADKPDWYGRYRQYLVSHLKRSGLYRPSSVNMRHVRKKMESVVPLLQDIRANGFKAPLEFYRNDDRMVLWKGYRRLVIAHVLGIGQVPLISFFDKQTARVFSPQNNMRHLQYPPSAKAREIGESQLVKWGTRATDKYWVHRYTELYDRYFAEMTKRTRTLLELGVARGASLALWREYFPKAHIYGAEINPDRWKKIAGNLKNTEVLVGDETDPKFLQKLKDTGPYDIIIDDASHEPGTQNFAFEALWPAVREYGYYVIEDIYRSFADNGNGRCLPADFEQRIYKEKDVSEIHWHTNIVFVRKAPQ